MNLFSNAKVSWNENEDGVLKLNREKCYNKTKMISVENQGTFTLRTSLEKNILETDAAYKFVRKTFKTRNGSLSQSSKCFKQKPIEET